MAKFQIKLNDGKSLAVSGRKFSYSVQGEAHDFIVHDAINGSGADQITRLASSMRVLVIRTDVSCLHCRDRVAAAVHEMDAMEERIGEARMRSVLAAAA